LGNRPRLGTWIVPTAPQCPRRDGPDKPTFRQAFQRRRCLIPNTGFSAWMKTGRHQQPFLYRLAGKELSPLSASWREDDPAARHEFPDLVDGVQHHTHDTCAHEGTEEDHRQLLDLLCAVRLYDNAVADQTRHVFDWLNNAASGRKNLLAPSGTRAVRQERAIPWRERGKNAR
jgi:hypothetical protein